MTIENINIKAAEQYRASKAARQNQGEFMDGNYTARQIAIRINEAISHSVNGRSGKNVYGQDCDTVQHRIISARARVNVVQGKSLNSGKWFTLSGWFER